MRKFDASDFKGVCYAHRGLYDNGHGVPENSLPAFRAAVETGYGVELDVQLSADGQVVVFHDDTLDRICGVHGNVSDYPLKELQQMKLLDTAETIPLFTDVLSVLRKGTGPVIVELKTGGRNKELCAKALDLLQDYPGIFCIESFDPRIVRWFRKKAPDIFRGQLAQPKEFYGEDVSPFSARLLASCRFSFLNKPDFIAYRIGPRPPRVLEARRNGVLLIAWTCCDPEKDMKENDSIIFEYCRPPLRY